MTTAIIIGVTTLRKETFGNERLIKICFKPGFEIDLYNIPRGIYLKQYSRGAQFQTHYDEGYFEFAINRRADYDEMFNKVAKWLREIQVEL